MTNQQITKNLTENHKVFTDYILSLNEADYEYAAIGKWSAGQQLEHIIKSVSPVANALAMSLDMLAATFGKANRPSANSGELVSKYKAKLAEGGIAPSTFVPENQAFADREQLIQRLEKAVSNLCQKATIYSETDLDIYILPHPLLGKLTLREMLYFTIYHVQHHEELIKKYLKQQP